MISKTVCQHYWLIESPNGPIARACCKYCKAKTTLYNGFPEQRFNPTDKTGSIGKELGECSTQYYGGRK